MKNSNNWREIEIGQIGEVVTGGTPSTKHLEFFGDQYPFITPSDLDFDSRTVKTERYLSEEGRGQLKNRLLPPNAICFTSIGATIGKMCMTTYSSFTNQQINSIVVDQTRHDPWFVYYLLKTQIEQIKALAGGSATPIVSKSKFAEAKVFVPPLPTQRKIAAILSAYDDLIENNTRRIALLERMAQLLYREWFVRFRFPGHESARMVASALGEIPEGWEVGRLDDALILQRGFDLPRKARQAGNIPVYAATGITDTHNEVKVKAPGVVTGRSGSLGTVMYVEEDYWPLNTTLWVREFRRATPIYAYYLLIGLHLEQYNSGAAVPTLNRNDIHGLPVILPPAYTLNEFDDYILPMLVLRKNLRERNEVLRRTRDLLLPRLIAGEVDVTRMEIDI